MSAGVAAAYDVATAQRRTVRTLVAAQAVAAMGSTIGIATASPLARDLSGSESQAGPAQTCQVLGAAVASSTTIADHAPLEARTDVQGAADLVMGLSAAAAGGLAGLVVGAWGYATLAAGPAGDTPGSLRESNTCSG